MSETIAAGGHIQRGDRRLIIDYKCANISLPAVHEQVKKTKQTVMLT